MNARELLDAIEAGGNPRLTLDAKLCIRRALALQAAAEANDGNSQQSEN